MDLFADHSFGVFLESALRDYGVWVVLVGTFLTGELTILTAFILVAQGWLTAESVFFFAVLGTLMADFFWFTIGRLFPGWMKNLKAYKSLSGVPWLTWELKLHHQALVLLIVKFLYGFRWITIVYFAVGTIKTREFIIFDIVGTVIFVAVLALIGIPTGYGITSVLPAYHLFVTLAMAVAGAFVLSIVLRSLMVYMRDLWKRTPTQKL